MYIIVNTLDPEEFWNNESGWGAEETADLFSEEEQEEFELPLFGAWVEVQPN